MAIKEFDCIILGGGPAGLSASLYCARAGLKTAIIDTNAIGGAPANYCEIENYLGFNKIQGFELCEKFENHIDEFEIEKYPYEEIKKIDFVFSYLTFYGDAYAHKTSHFFKELFALLS